MKNNIILYVFLLLTLTKCTSQNNKKSQVTVVSHHVKDHNNITWPQYRGIKGNGKVKSNFTPRKEVTLRWEFEYQGGKPTPLVIADRTAFFGTASKDIYAIDSTGNLKWKIKLDAKISHSLLLAKNVLIAAPDSTMVYGINATNGTIIWKRDFAYKYKSYTSKEKGLFGMPIVTDPNKFVIKKRGLNEAPPILNGNTVMITTYQEIVGLDIQTGKTKYRINKHEGKTAIPVITKDLIYINTGNRFVYALNKSNKKLKWETKLFDLTDVQPTIDEEHLYVSSLNYLYKLHQTSGKKIKLLSFAPHEKIGIIDNNIYYSSEDGYHTHAGSNFGSYIRAYNLITEDEEWNYNIEGKYISDIIMIGNYIYCTDSYGNIRALEKKTGTLFFKKRIVGLSNSSLSYADGILYGSGSKKGTTNIIFALQ